MKLWAHHQKEGIFSASFATNFVPLDWTLLLRTWQRTHTFWNWLMSCWFYTVKLENARKTQKITQRFFSILLPNTTILNCGGKFQLNRADFVRVITNHFGTANVHHAINKNTATVWFSIFSSQLNSWLPTSLKQTQNPFSDSCGFKNPIWNFLNETRR